jgi:hypothetical protein
MRARDCTNGRRPARLLDRMSFARNGIARAPAERDCGKDDGDAGKPEGERRRARPTGRREIAASASNMRWTCGQHPHRPDLKREKASHPSQLAG